jgi:hypothetical protein
MPIFLTVRECETCTGALHAFDGLWTCTIVTLSTTIGPTGRAKLQDGKKMPGLPSDAREISCVCHRFQATMALLESIRDNSPQCASRLRQDGA